MCERSEHEYPRQSAAKVEKLRKILSHDAWHGEDCAFDNSYEGEDECDCGFANRLAELEAIDKGEG